jgi:hypothetical protein
MQNVTWAHNRSPKYLRCSHDTVLVIMEFDQYCTIWGVDKQQQSCWRVLWVPKGHKWACWKGRKPTAWHLMPPDKHLGKHGCNYQFCKHEMFNPCKSRSVNIFPSIFVHVQLHQFCIVICCQFIFYYLSVVIRHLASCFAFTLIRSSQSFQIWFCFWSFCFHPIIRYSVTQCYFCPDTENVYQVFRSP